MLAEVTEYSCENCEGTCIGEVAQWHGRHAHARLKPVKFLPLWLHAVWGSPFQSGVPKLTSFFCGVSLLSLYAFPDLKSHFNVTTTALKLTVFIISFTFT